MSDLAAALMVAIRVHAGQVDKQGEPYLLHVLRVVEAVGDEAKPVAALHDVVEDAGTHLRGAELSANVLGARHFWSLMALTRSEGEGTERPGGGFYGHTYADYIQHIVDSGDEIAREVKLADLRDNLARIPKITQDPATRDKLWGYSHGRSAQEWASLARRYEKAIATLESVGVTA